MYRHPYFNLRLHTDDALCAILGSQVAFRQTLHEWPLSCVQELRLADGRHLVYKAQWGPSVEDRFYEKARSPLLLSTQVIYRTGRYQALVQPFIETPTLKGQQQTENEIKRIGQDVCVQIAAIPYFGPVYLDFSSADKWIAIADRVLASLNKLKESGAFQQIWVPEISSAFHSREVLSVLTQPAVLCHGDLSGDNLFVLPEGGYKVIDWAMPYFGPPGLDMVSLLESRGSDLPGALDRGLVAMYWLLRIAWFSSCAVRWFPPGVKTYERQIADLTGQIAGLRLEGMKNGH